MEDGALLRPPGVDAPGRPGDIAAMMASSSSSDRTVRRRLALLAVAALPAMGGVAAGACGGEPPALMVDGTSRGWGEVAFTRDDLVGLPEEQVEILADLAIVALAAAEAAGDSVGSPLLERREREYLARVERAERALDSAGVGDDVLRARYLSDPRLELTVRHLIVLSERHETDQARAEARAKAERALERIRAGEDFPEVAAEVSEEPGAEGREGLLEPGREGAWVDEFWNAARALDPGEISPVTETEYGFHVLRLEVRDTVPFDEARTGMVLEVADLMGARSAAGPPPLPEGYDASPDATEGLTDPAAPDTLTVARWEDGSLTLGELRRDLAALPGARWRAALNDLDAAGDALAEAARLRADADAARARGATVPPGVRAEAEREWSDRWTRWTTTLDFTPGMSSESVRTGALEAMGSTRQNTVLVREELPGARPLLRYRAEVWTADEGGGEG